MKRKTKNLLTKFVTFLLITTMIMPQITFAEYINEDSKGSINMEDNLDDNIGIDKCQGQETWYADEVVQDSTQETYVYVSQASTFGVTIPKTIILDGQTKQGNYLVSIIGNISGQENITVIPDENVTMSQYGKNDIIATITQDKTSWLYNELDTNGNGNIIAKDMSAGSWNGQFNFNIKLNRQDPFVIAYDENGTNLNAYATTILGSTKTSLLNELLETGRISNVDEITTLVNIRTDTFNNSATTTFNVKNIANVGDTVIIYHYDETNNMWEYIDTCEVTKNGKITTNFTSFSPIAFKVIDGVHTHIDNNGDVVCEICNQNFAGLYDANDNLLATWDELVNNYGLSVTKDFAKETYTPAFENDKSSLYYIMKNNTELSTGTKLVIQNDTTKIGKWALAKTSLTNVIMPSSITHIRWYAFQYSKLQNIRLSNNLTTIEMYAFQYCYYLKEIKIPASVTTINSGAFRENNALENVYFYNTTPITFDNSSIFSKAKNKDIITTFYFKNAMVASKFTTTYYKSEYGVKSTDYDW